jgi:hypothetical protein
MEYNASNAAAGPTDIYFNHELHYPHGALVTINGVPVTEDGQIVDNMSVTCSVDGVPITTSEADKEAYKQAEVGAERRYTSHVLLALAEDAPSSVAVSVTVSRCSPLTAGQCTCRQ